MVDYGRLGVLYVGKCDPLSSDNSVDPLSVLMERFPKHCSYGAFLIESYEKLRKNLVYILNCRSEEAEVQSLDLTRHQEQTRR